MSTDQSHASTINASKPSESAYPSDYAPYPKLDPHDVAPAKEDWTSISVSQQTPAQPVKSESVAAEARAAPISGDATTTMPPESNPYVSPAPATGPSASVKNTVDTVKDVLGKWGKKAAEATKKAEDLAGNMWQHMKTGPSFADAAVSRIAQGTKVLTEGGYEKVFRQTFETVPEENLLKTYACYLSTSSGPVMGLLYLSTAKLAFCSDNPLSYNDGGRTEWSYYKIVIPMHQLRAVNPSTSKINPSEKYIQIITIDNHEFWFIGFVHYDSAVRRLQEAVKPPV